MLLGYRPEGVEWTHTDTHAILPLLKTGGVYENEHITATILPPEDRAEGKPFIDYRQKAP